MTVDFQYEVDGLDITLENLSVDYDTCEWEVRYLGQSVDTETSCDPYNYVATEAGLHIITLTITKGTESMTKGIEIYLRDAGSPNNVFTILRQVELMYPGILESYWELCESYKIKWQTILFPTLNEFPDLAIPTEDMHNESEWPYLWNALIANLVARDIFLDTQTKLGGLDPGVVQGGGPIKKITTGPVDTEWHSHAKMMDSVFKDGGLLDELEKRICAIATQLDISFSFCKSQPFFPMKITPMTDVKRVNQLLKFGAHYILTTFYK